MKKKTAKVISIGNIAMGGTGKTPHTIAVAKHYIEKGEKVAILSRGYKGKVGYSTNVISDGKNILLSPPMASDEPYMMARDVAGVVVITGKCRQDSLEVATRNYGTTLAVLDDAFQHKKIAKDAEILLLDYNNPISTGFPFPFGYLREFPCGIKRADIVVFTRAKDTKIPEKVKKYVENKPIFFSDIVFENIVLNDETLNITDIKGRNIAAFSAVASNKSFYNSLVGLGLKVDLFKSFQDHAIPPAKMLEQIVDKSENPNIDFYLTTEKDYVKLPDYLKKYFAYLKINIKINEEALFYETLDKLIYL